MSRAFGLRLALTALALACLVSASIYAFGAAAQSDFALQLVQQKGDRYAVHTRGRQQLPPPLRAGDLIPIRQLSPATRAVLFSHHEVPPGTVFAIPVLRDGRVVNLSVQAVPATSTTIENIENAFIFIAALAIALLTLWRGRDRAAWGFAAMFLLQFVIWGILDVPAAPAMVFWLLVARAVLTSVVVFPALFVVADGLSGTSLPPRWRMRARLVVAAVALGMLGAFAIHVIPLISTGATVLPAAYTALQRTLFACGYLVTLLVLVGGYRFGAHEQKLRIRWVLWSTVLLFASIALLFALPQVSFAQQLRSVLQVLALLGYLYAILRTRLIDVGFVIDRALVFALITALVFGTFSILEQGLHQFAVGEKIGWVVQALAALALALVLSPLHHRLESWIEQIFFRSQRLAILALNRFAAECPYVERETHVLEMAIERLRPHCASVSIYERAGSGYRRWATSDNSWPPWIDADDPVFVALRASHEPVTLGAQANHIGTEGLALPMTVAESLLGALVCRPRDGEQFASEMRAALANVTQHLGMAVIGLRHRAHARLVADLASGRVDSAGARRRAIALLEGEVPRTALSTEP